MFNRKHRKVRYAKCPYCGKSPVISEGRSITDKNELVMHYKCPKKSSNHRRHAISKPSIGTLASRSRQGVESR